jgi:urease beta subunit
MVGMQIATGTVVGVVSAGVGAELGEGETNLGVQALKEAAKRIEVKNGAAIRLEPAMDRVLLMTVIGGNEPP